jgi:hypothetical protein
MDEFMLKYDPHNVFAFCLFLPVMVKEFYGKGVLVHLSRFGENK